MRINKYEGYNLDALIEKAKEELGKNIKILSYESEDERSLLFPFKKRTKYTLFVESPSSTDRFLDILSKEKKNQEIDSFLERIEKMIDKKLEAFKLQQLHTLPTPAHSNGNSFMINDDFSEFSGDAVELIRKLLEKGVEPKNAKIVVKEACGFDIDTNKLDLSTTFFKEALVKGIERKIKFTGPIKIKNTRLNVKAFVGPTGVGKTTNLFKIASELVINQKLNVAVISIDTFKVGAVQQARAYANILNIPFFAITDSKNLKKTLSNLLDVDAVLIDTVGRSHYDYWRLGEMKEILGASSDLIDISLVISCNYKNSESIEIVNRYKTFFPINSIFFTKIDETYKPGILLNLPIRSEIPVSFISTGQRVPEDIRLLNPEKIADYLLVGE
jgi:flagellar biosynthesis protein FlhF